MYYTQTCALYMRACRIGPVSVWYRPEAVSIGQVRDRFWCVDYKTTLVAFLTFLFLGGGICASGKFALANMSWLSRVVVVSTLSSLVASQVVKMTASDAVGGGRVASWRRFVFQCLNCLLGIHCMFCHKIHDNISQRLGDLCDLIRP